jgi:hypothetical protein
MKVLFVMLLVLNIVALCAGVGRFFVTFAQVGEPPAYYQGIEAMRDFLGPSLKWLVGVAIANLVFAAFAVFRCRRTTT